MPIRKPDMDYVDIHDDVSDEARDKFIGMKVPLSHLGTIQEGVVKKRKRHGETGELLGKSNDNPLLDTRYPVLLVGCF